MKNSGKLSAEEFRILFDSMDSGFCVIEMNEYSGSDPDFRFAEVSTTFEKQAGLNNLTGKYMSQLSNAPDKFWTRICQDVAIGRKPVRMEQRVSFLQNLWFEIYAIPVGDPVCKRLALLFRDITDKKKIGDSLEKTQDMLSAAFKNSPYAMILSRSDDGLILDVNDAFLDFFKATAAEVIGQTSLNLKMYSNPADRDILLKQLYQKGRVRNFELVMQRSDGEEVPVLFSIELLKSDENTNMLTVINDISERKQAEYVLRESEELFRNLFERHGSIMLLIENESGQILDANLAASRFYGYSRDEMRTMNIDQINQLPPEEVARERKKVTGEDKQYFQFPHKLANGEIKWVEVHSSLIRYHNKDLLFSVIYDITEQKKIAEQIAQTNRELKVTHDFMESVLHIAMHDLRSPIANLHLCLQCIEMQPEPQEKEKYFTFFKEIVEKLITTLTDLTGILEFLSSKKINAMPVSLAGIIESVIHEHDHTLSNGTIKYSLAVKDIKYVKPFAESLFRNLISNAIKYRSNERSLKIQITGKKTSEFIVVCVKDNGIGIDLDKYGNSIFQPFKRFTDKSSGTGIGLYLIKNIVERNGGHVKLESKPNEGTTVCCYLKEYTE